MGALPNMQHYGKDSVLVHLKRSRMLTKILLYLFKFRGNKLNYLHFTVFGFFKIRKKHPDPIMSSTYYVVV